MLGCLHADLKGRTGRTEGQCHLQTVWPGEPKTNKQGTKPDLVCVFQLWQGEEH